MTRMPRWLLISLAAVLLPAAGTVAQEASDGEKNAGPQPLVIKVYPVSDLVVRAPDYQYEGSYLPSIRQGSFNAPFTFGQSTVPTVGGGVMGYGGGMGGGMYQVPAEAAPAANAVAGGLPTGPVGAPQQSRRNVRHVGMADLMNAITSVAGPTTWDEVGGPGAILTVGGALVVSQTADVHAQIKDLLDQLRKERAGMQPLTIEARWLALDSTQLASVKSTDTKKQRGSGRLLDPQALDKLPESTRRFAGQISCFDGQTVYIVSGRMETFLQGGIPVVGGTGAGYQAVLLTPQIGALLQITPFTAAGGDSVQLDLRSSLTRQDEAGESVKFHSAMSNPKLEPSVQVDRLNVAAQQFATSVRVPLGVPVLVGGMTIPGHNPDSHGDQVYLIIEVEAAN
jgi:hypothetical protein